MARLVDWELARQTGTRLVSAGPPVTPYEAHQWVADLRMAADRAPSLVRETTQLDPPTMDSPTFVIDRPSWIRANCESMGSLVTGAASQCAARTAGIETGAVLAFLAPKVLGQFDPYSATGGRLLLVAPNILHVCEHLRLPRQDFQLWVCLHEETHRVQFHHAPWLADYVRDRVNVILAKLSWRLVDVLRAVSQSLANDKATMVDAFFSGDQRRAVDEITAAMTLLEGHADVMMDQVGPSVIGELNRIRARFEQRRDANDGLAARLLGLEAKRRQYRDGATFCRYIMDQTDIATLNLAFSEPAALPTIDELRDPPSWLGRVTGFAA